jgi:hypothetical protein
MAVSEHHIREALARYVSGEVSLVEFQDWFIPRAWEVLAEGSSATDVTSELELLLAEFTNGQWTERDLREALKPHATVPLGGIVFVSSPAYSVATIWSQPWIEPTGLFHWFTSAAGAELGNTTLDVRGRATIETPRISVEQAT